MIRNNFPLQKQQAQMKQICFPLIPVLLNNFNEIGFFFFLVTWQ